MEEEINKGKYTPPRDSFDWEDSITYTYGRSFAKLYAAFQQEEGFGNYTDFATNKWDGSELFKLNLYLIVFNSTDPALWKENGLDKITGFENKYLFNTWCFFNRFQFFSQLCEEHKPKLIICTGVDYLRDFLMFFGGNSNIDSLNSGTIKPQSENNKLQ